MNDYERGYLEAIIDGEGYLGWHKIGKYRVPILAIGNNSKPLLEKVKSIIGHGSICFHKQPLAHHQDHWKYTCYSNGLRAILPELNLIIKAERQKEMLEWLASRDTV